MIRLITVALLLALLSAPVEARKRKRVKRITHRKPPVVWVYPDVCEVVTYDQYWAAEQRKREARARALWALLVGRRRW